MIALYTHQCPSLTLTHPSEEGYERSSCYTGILAIVLAVNIWSTPIFFYCSGSRRGSEIPRPPSSRHTAAAAHLLRTDASAWRPHTCRRDLHPSAPASRLLCTRRPLPPASSSVLHAVSPRNCAKRPQRCCICLTCARRPSWCVWAAAGSRRLDWTYSPLLAGAIEFVLRALLPAPHVRGREHVAAAV